MDLLVDLDRLPVDVLRTAQRKVQETGGDRVVGQAVDQDEAAGIAIFRVRIEGNRLVEMQVAYADLVQMQRLRRQVFEGVDVDFVLRCGDGHPDGFWPDLQ